MGIITRLYHRSDGLSDNPFNRFFMDMGENIHIHYRDLRIELSVDEFLEFANLCEEYIPQVKAEIEAGYRDGVQPNTNQAHTWKMISDGKLLDNTIAYNPNRISLEENVDGYHLHVRNYKLLLDKPSFLNFMQAAREVLDKRETPVDLQETLELFAANELESRVEQTGRDGDRETASVTVEPRYFKKAQEMLEAVQYTRVEGPADSAVYEKANARVALKAGPVAAAAPAAAAGNSPVMPLPDYLRRNAEAFTPRAINELKLQILDFFAYVRKNDLASVVELDYRRLIFDTEQGRVIFPSKERPEPGDPDRELDRLTAFLRDLGLSFVKPQKVLYDDAKAQALQAAFHTHMKREVAAQPCVQRVYLLNPAAHKKPGVYEAPLVHHDWAKLGSDFDLLIEVDERYAVPSAWTHKFFVPAPGSEYYHLGNIDFPVDSPYPARYPNLDFYHHMIEAYLFFPSTGDAAVKDAYLAKFSAQLLYDKEGLHEDTPQRLRTFLARAYGLAVEGVEMLGQPSFNEVFRVTTPDGAFAAKVMRRSDFTPAVADHAGQGRHIDYEADLLRGLAAREAPVAVPVPGTDGNLVQTFEDRACMLFPFVDSEADALATDEQRRVAAQTLARTHGALAEVTAATDMYRFEEAVDYWLDNFETLYPRFTAEAAERRRFEALLPEIRRARKRIDAATDLPRLHAHGDVCPRNFLYVDGRALLFDFQVAHYGPRLEDVAEGALEFAWQGAGLDRQAVDAFVAAYETETPLTDTERELLASMLFLQAALKLARLFRVEVLFGYTVDRNRVAAFLDYAEGSLGERPQGVVIRPARVSVGGRR